MCIGLFVVWQVDGMEPSTNYLELELGSSQSNSEFLSVHRLLWAFVERVNNLLKKCICVPFKVVVCFRPEVPVQTGSHDSLILAADNMAQIGTDHFSNSLLPLLKIRSLLGGDADLLPQGDLDQDETE